jgi:hypothetical protein
MRGRCPSKAPARCRVSALAICLAGVTACASPPDAPPDDAKAAGMTPADFRQTAADVFQQMDGGLRLTPDEIKGRNTWLLWTAGNQLFWDRVAREGYGVVDLLKTLDSRQRPFRFAEMGLINEPGFRRATKPDANGLWLDERAEPAPAGVDEKIYGRSSGVIGLRIYSNPDFGDAARKKWAPDRYYTDQGYYTDPTLVRPYRIGVTCGLCHVGPHPLHPPPDPENPRWEHLASAIGNQYFREGKVFAVGARPGSFLWEMLNAQPPGTSDTSRAASDHINNPGATNAIFELDARLAEAAEEKMSGGARELAGARVRRVPHILKDGADSVGVAGAMLRVFVNEGLYSQQWLTDHQLLLGLGPQRPFSVARAVKNSVYWQATAERVDNVGKFFRRITPMHLEDAPGGAAHITSSQAVMDRGKMVFGELCAPCHSSKQPPAGIDPRSPEGLQWYRASVMRPDFRDGNLLSDDRRYPVSRIKTNACRALATNATAGHIWDNFSSDTYKALNPVGVIETFNPADEATPHRFTPPAGGPGYYRPPSLVSLWASAPFLHNNSVGDFTGDPSVAGRMRAFNDAVEKLLWPARRRGKASVLITSQPSYIRIPQSFVPDILKPLCRNGVLEIGPIPKGTPINLLANIEPDVDNLLRLIPDVNAALGAAAARGTSAGLAPESPRDAMLKTLTPTLLAVSKCPDLIEDRGHEFGATLSDRDKRALIEFLKTL